MNEEKERVATEMLREGESLEKIAKYSRLAENAILNLAKTLVVVVL